MLTLKAHRSRTPKKSRRISTIPAGRFDGRLGNVNAVDTGPRRSESPWVLRQCPAPPSQVCPHRLLPAACAGVRWSWFDSGPAQSWPESYLESPSPRGSGSTDQGLCVLHEGPTYLQYPYPPPVDPHPRAVHPDDDGSHHSDRGTPPTGRSSSTPTWQTHPTGVSDVMTSETFRSHETTQ